ncbi:hypothetical protein [Myxococcus vastator]|uniref:hypothetical protein n=1 Tax=Myxococcus vastator TaxID=2709664 RepID=UPI0013D2335F|nr:hypothetical protein [Myxococcus vastator]
MNLPFRKSIRACAAMSAVYIMGCGVEPAGLEGEAPTAAVAQPLAVGESVYGKYYQHDIVAATGDPAAPNLSQLKGYVSINNSGQTVFVGKMSNGSEHLFVGGASGAVDLTPNETTARRFPAGAQINNSGIVVAPDSLTSSYFLRRWALTPGSHGNVQDATLLARSSTETAGLSFIGAYPSLSASGKVAFVGTDSTGKYQLALPNPNSTTRFTTKRQTIQAARPSMDGEGNIVLSSDFSGPIEWWSADLSTNIVLADNDGSCFTDLGRNPGISIDGTVVVFYGNLQPVCATTTGIVEAGPGIFAMVYPSGIGEGGSYYMYRIAGRQIENFNVDKNATPPPANDTDGICEVDEKCMVGELGFTSTGAGIGFQSFAKDARVSVSIEDVGSSEPRLVVAFVGTPTAAHPMGLFSANEGLWTTEVRMFVGSSSARLTPERPRPVVQVGDNMGAETVASLGETGQPVFAQVTNAPFSLSGTVRNKRDLADHRLGYYFTATSGKQFIVRAERLDTDDDGLPDHVEEHGMDFDQNGTIDLDLPSLYGVKPDGKDIIVELDYLVAAGNHSHKPVVRNDGKEFTRMVDAFRRKGIHLAYFVDDAIPETGPFLQLTPQKRKPGVSANQVMKMNTIRFGTGGHPCSFGGFIGTHQERTQSGNCEAILGARLLRARSEITYPNWA